MKATKAIKELPWPEDKPFFIEQQHYEVFAQLIEQKKQQLLIVTFRANEKKMYCWEKLKSFRLILSAERRDFTVLHKDGTEKKKIPWFKNCYTEISQEDEETIREYLGRETPWTGEGGKEKPSPTGEDSGRPMAAPAKAGDDGNHQMRNLDAWCGEAYAWQKEERKRRRGEIEDEAVGLCPEELPEHLTDYVRTVMLPEDNVLIYKRGNVRGTCFRCRQKVRAVAPQRFRQGEYANCPECGAKVACVLEGSMSFKADYVNNLAALQMGTDGKTLFIRHWHLMRDMSAQWEDIQGQLREIARYAIRGKNVAKWSKEYKERYSCMGPSIRKPLKNWIKVQGTKVYDGGYYFMLDTKLLPGTSIQYAGLDLYVESKQTKKGRNPIRFSLDAARYPVMEFLMKAGYYTLLWEAISGTQDRNAIRWNAEKLKDAFRFPLRLLKFREPDAWSFQDLKTLGEIWANWGGKIKDQEILAATILRARAGKIEDTVLAFTTASKAAAYLEAQEKREPGTARLYEDYINDCEALGLDLFDKQVLFPPRLREAHARTISMKKIKANDMLRDAFTKAANRGRKWNLEGKRLFIRVAETPEELIREGEILSHCVGGYAKNMAEGELLIYFVRKVETPEEPFYTLDLRKKEIYQCRTKKNADYGRDPEVKAFVDSWLENIVKKNDRRKTA